MAIQGAILLFENEHGELLASVDAMSITKIRTGAVSAVASRALANPDSKILAILGCGAQGYSHLDALAKTFDLTEFRCWDVNKSSAEALAACAQTEKSLNSKACATVEEAVYGADIICTVTPAKTPILCRGWVKDGAHINAIGACAPTTRELDSALMADARVYCDNTESILHESGDFLIPLGENRFGEDHLIGTVGDVLLGKLSGRKGRNEITVFDAVGMAVEDIACAIYLYHQSLG
ncbi:MAG: ornithine cyclodeaminase family protein [Lachnospiraceae bacterium]|nr:ornithine cyclodeaminase family protein [Lachnospiraceae bacterium]